MAHLKTFSNIMVGCCDNGLQTPLSKTNVFLLLLLNFRPISGSWTYHLFFLNGPIPAYFCLFLFFSHSNSNDKYTI